MFGIKVSIVERCYYCSQHDNGGTVGNTKGLNLELETLHVQQPHYSLLLADIYIAPLSIAASNVRVFIGEQRRGRNLQYKT